MTEKRNILLYPLSLIFGLIIAIRNFLYDRGILHSERFDIPVICVGNITVGGTGKTPHTEYIISLLSKSFKTAVLSRGYKRKSRGFVIATTSSTVNDIGDEPLQISGKFPGIMVAVDSDRVNGVRKIMETAPGVEVIILDDGFQHRRIAPGFSVILSDFGRPMMKDHLLPYGTLRESLKNLHRANVILITKTPSVVSAAEKKAIKDNLDLSPDQRLLFTSLVYKNPVPVFDGTGVKPKREISFSESSIVLITGIANPKPLIEHLREKTKEIKHLSFPDHYNFSERDIQNFGSVFNELKSTVKFLITTEKDAVRLKEFSNIADELKAAFYYIPVSIDFPDNDRETFDNLIIEYVRKNKRNHRISKE